MPDSPPGSFRYCPVCMWQDDNIQFQDPDYAGGANRLSLRQSQHNYFTIGAKEARLKTQVRPATEDEVRDVAWQRLSPLVVATVDEVRRVRGSWSPEQERAPTVGLVPTMGFLHEGHLSLVRAARAQNDAVFVSIFVNPTQFGPNEDLSTYPRDMQRDLDRLRAEGADYVFAPDASEMYPEGFSTSVDAGAIALPLEGAARPGHFTGVATVVLKLLNIVQPTRAYFGRKDAQQLAVIRRIVRDLNVPTEIVAMPTVREPDGLAMSSRNAYLNASERQAALVLHEALDLAREMWTRGARDVDQFKRRMMELIEAEEMAHLDYVSVSDTETLEELDRIRGRALVSMAVRIGKTRLIDNIVLGED